MANQDSKSVLSAVKITLGVIALTAMVIAAYVYIQTPEEHREGITALVFAIIGLIFAMAFLFAVGGPLAGGALATVVKKIIRS